MKPRLPDAIEAMEQLQEMARSHPDLAPKLQGICALIAKQQAAIIDIQRVLLASHLVEHMKK